MEYSPEREKAASILAEHIAKQSGAALIIDYGYSLTTIGDTLQAVQDHKSSPVLSTPGAADITAHVDFESIYRATMNSKILFFGPISQRQFLTRIGIKTRASSLMSKATPENAEKTYSALMRLIAPELMGTMFKAVAIVGGNKFIPPGFDKVSNTLKHKHETIP